MKDSDEDDEIEWIINCRIYSYSTILTVVSWLPYLKIFATNILSCTNTRTMVDLGLTEPTRLIKKGLVICRAKRLSHSFGIFNGENPLDFSFPIILLEVSAFIFISRALRFLLKPLRQPMVVTEILGGIILGPSVLSRNEKFRAYLFPDNAQYVIKNLGIIGFVYFLFVSGVKMDFTAINKAEKKQWYIALVGVILPLCCSVTVAVLGRHSFDKQTANSIAIFGITCTLSITAFPVLYPIVRELNLLSSEVGRLALLTAIIGDVIGGNGLLIFEASKQGEHRPIAVLWYLISFFVVTGSIFGGVRQGMMWIVRTTPEGKQVDQIYVITILLGVMVVGLVADALGLAIGNGPFWLGLAVPEGPPLGAILVEKTETILLDIFLPFSFMYVGMITDVYSISSNWSHLQPLFFMVFVAYIVKVISTFVVARFCDMTTRDSLTLSLIMSLRGEMELVMFIHWMDFKMIGPPQFTILVLLSVSATALATPLISILYDPTRPYMVNKRRNIQHSHPNTELNIVICIHGEENLSGLTELLEVSNPTSNSPFYVHALSLVELIGRANPIFIDHENQENSSDPNYDLIHNALKVFKETRGEYINIHSYTAISPKRSMYQDICELALSKKACLIILPHNLNGIQGVKQNLQPVNTNVLIHAPCSVGILVDKCPYRNLVNNLWRSTMCHVVVLFLGGPDAREALAYADRMAASPYVYLTVFRFLVHDSEGVNEMEAKLDDGVVTSFWVKNERKERIIYREVVVSNGEETIGAIRAMKSNCCDLWIVGRKHGINPVILEGMSSWSERNELGIIGDFVASVDFDSKASVLVVQQQVLRDHKRVSGSVLKNVLFGI